MSILLVFLRRVLARRLLQELIVLLPLLFSEQSVELFLGIFLQEPQPGHTVHGGNFLVIPESLALHLLTFEKFFQIDPLNFVQVEPLG